MEVRPARANESVKVELFAIDASPDGPRALAIAESSPQTVVLAKKLARYPVHGQKRSLRDVAAELEAAGYVTGAGTRYGDAAVARMIC